MKTYGKILTCQGRESRSGDRQIVVTMLCRDRTKPVDDPERFIRVVDYPTRSSRGRPHLSAFFEACGVPAGTKQLDPSDLCDQIIGMELQINEYQGRKELRPKFQSYFALGAEQILHAQEALEAIEEEELKGDKSEDDIDFVVGDSKPEEKVADAEDDDLIW